MQFSALNSDSNINPNSNEEFSNPFGALNSTREAVESEAFKNYYRALTLLQEDQYHQAKELLVSVLNSSYLTDSLQDIGKKISIELLKGKAAKLKLAAICNLSRIAEKQESWIECISRCEQALEIDKTDTMVWYRLGRVALKVLELELSAYSFIQTLSRANYMSPARKSLIPILYAIYRYDECLLQCSELLAIAPLSQLAADYANWIMKTQPYTDPPKTPAIDSLLQELHTVGLSELKESPHIKYGNELRHKQNIAYPVKTVLEEWSPTSQLLSLHWVELGAYLLSVFREAEERHDTLRPCRVWREDEELLPREESPDLSKGEEIEKKVSKRRGQELLEDMPACQRRSLRSSQQEGRDREMLNKKMGDLISYFFAPRWSYFQQTHCMSTHPSYPKKVFPPVIDSKLLLKSQPSIEGESAKVKKFLRSHNLSPICSLLPRYLEASSQMFLLRWTHSSTHKLHSIISNMYLTCHGRFLSLPDISTAPSHIDTAHVVLMFIEGMIYQNLPSPAPQPDPDPLLSQAVLEAAFFLERVCYSPLVPFKHWHTFFLRSSWSLSRLAEYRGLIDKQIMLLDHALQTLELCNSIQESAVTPDSNSDCSSSNHEGFSLYYPPDEFILPHPNIHTVINRAIIQESMEKAITANSIDRGILFDYYLKGDHKHLISSIKPFVSDSPNSPFQFLMVRMKMTSECSFIPNLIQVALECIVNGQMEESEIISLLNKILSKLVISICDTLDLTNDMHQLEIELNTLSDVIAVFVNKHKQHPFSIADTLDTVGFIWNLLRILEFYWDIRNTSMRKLIPISPAICLLYYCIQKCNLTADHATESKIIDDDDVTPLSSTAKSLPDNKRRMLFAQKRLSRVNPALGFLFECHELFGGDHFCCSIQALLLHLLLRDTSNTLHTLTEEDSCLKELLEGELIQILFCLFGYPAKRYRALGLSEHRENDDVIPSFDWPSCYLMLHNLYPSSLPTFDDNKSTGISPDLIIVCKRLADQLPYKEYTVISLEILETFIVSESDSFPEQFEVTISSREAECLAMAYYVIADDYLKCHSEKAIDFYKKHLLFYPKHPDSWAGLTLANFRKLQYHLRDRTINTLSHFVSEVTDYMLSVSRCFKQVNRLYPSHSQLLERYGHYCYLVNSFWKNISYLTSTPLPHLASYSIPDTQSELKQSLSVFQKALDFETHIAEPWLYHYLLAKIKKKLLYPFEECFSHLISSSRILHTDGVYYPDHIDCNTTGSAIQAIEVHYVIHSMFIQALLRDKMTALSVVESALLALKEVSPLARTPPPDTAITQCIHDNRFIILRALNIHQVITWHSSLEDRFVSVLVDCIHGLLVCLARFPTHYKSHYRLIRTLWDLNPEVFYTTVRSLLIGPVSSDDIKNDKQLPLFNLKSNLFANMWAYDKSYDIDRPGSFVYHMYRHVSLLFSFLSYRHSAEAFISALSLLKLKPEFARTYLRECERVHLYNAGLLMTAQVLESVYSQGLVGGTAKSLNLLKASYILHSFVLKSLLPSAIKDQLLERLGILLERYFQLYRGPPQEGEYSLNLVLSSCAQLTTVSVSDQVQLAKKPKPIKPKPPAVS
ncbi:Calcineurin-binding protein cabin-1 [Oopsacas minuta]|uniref:Calcineurin-binding protein cabin-1 n=1 Tax=Oopsacas minuta TaxID=111878 RepID=A0AAV7JCG1_9METZ|nr:Calcineurin-binding protein cabin-1 [Oopsacas minuta]